MKLGQVVICNGGYAVLTSFEGGSLRLTKAVIEKHKHRDVKAVVLNGPTMIVELEKEK